MIKRIPNVEDIMIKDVVCASLPGTRDDVLNILRDKKVSGVPVIKNGKIIGIVSRTNILKKPEEEHLALLMTRNPYTIEIGNSLINAAKMLYKYKIRRLPVVDKGIIKGLITIADIINIISDLSIDTQINKYIKTKIYTTWENTPLSIVAYQMDLADIKSCLVIDEKLNLVGIISNIDIIAASIIEDRIEKSDMSSGIDEDIWTWKSTRDILNIYYNVSKVRLPHNKLAKDLMVTKLISATSIYTISDCARKMKRNKIDQIPIIDSSYKLKGILRDQDLLKPLIDLNF